MAKTENTKKVKVTTSILCVLAIIIGFVVGSFLFLYLNKEESDVFVSGDFEVHFLELGNKYCGDSIYIRCGDTDILIDAGSRNDSADDIINYVDQFVTDGVLEFVIATHADQDHISAFYSTSNREGIFEHYEVETIIDFANVEEEKLDKIDNLNTVIGKYCKARDEEVASGAKHFTARECFDEVNGAKRVYQISQNVEMEILYNEFYYEVSSDENNHSVCLMFNQGDNHYLFTGDLEKEGEERMVQYYQELGTPLPECVLYKAGHHGSGTSSTSQLLEMIKPEYVVICTCAGSSEYTDNNDSQFPYQVLIDRIAQYTDKVYVTSVVDNYVDKSEWNSSGTVKSMNGNIVFSVLNGEVKIDCSNNNLILKETDWFKEHRVMPEAWK